MGDRPLTIVRPPKVDFSTPFSRIEAVRTQRRRLVADADDIQASIRYLNEVESEGVRNAHIAVVWAATLLVTDALKIGLSAMDRRAAVLFNAQDKALERANRILHLLRLGKTSTREYILRDVDANLRPTVELVSEVRKAREELRKIGIKPSKEIDLTLNLGLTMTEDAVVVIQGMQQVGHVQSQANSNRRMMENHLNRVLNLIRKVDQEFTTYITQAEVLSRTA